MIALNCTLKKNFRLYLTIIIIIIKSWKKDKWQNWDQDQVSLSPSLLGMVPWAHFPLSRKMHSSFVQNWPVERKAMSWGWRAHPVGISSRHLQVMFNLKDRLILNSVRAGSESRRLKSQRRCPCAVLSFSSHLHHLRPHSGHHFVSVSPRVSTGPAGTPRDNSQPPAEYPTI